MGQAPARGPRAGAGTLAGESELEPESRSAPSRRLSSPASARIAEEGPHSPGLLGRLPNVIAVLDLEGDDLSEPQIVGGQLHVGQVGDQASQPPGCVL